MPENTGEPKWRPFIRTLANERRLTDADRARLLSLAGTMPYDQGMATIDWLKRQPYARSRPQGKERSYGKPTAQLGVYYHDGEIYVVHPSRSNPDRVMASRLVESPDRMTESGDTIPFETEYARGMVYRLKPEELMPLADAQEIMTRRRRCIAPARGGVCNRPLWAAESVDRGVGPVCWKRLRAILPGPARAAA